MSTKKKSNEETTAEVESCDASAIPIVDHDPVAAYVRQLISCYSHLANFYYDRFVMLLHICNINACAGLVAQSWQ